MNDVVRRAGALLGARAQRDVPLGPFTTYRVGGAAALYVAVDDDETLDAVVDAVVATAVPVLVVGRGSNLLVADAGFCGLALSLGPHFAQVRVDGTDLVAGAAALLPVVARQSASRGLTGLEWAVGVPGSVGGAVRMNAGGHGADMARNLVRVRVRDLRTGEDGIVPAADLDLAYRHSAIAPHHLVTEATFALAPGDVDRAEATLAEIVRWRRDHQPGGQNAGSVFANPPEDSAGRLIDACGLKGFRVGTAEVSTKHANFIQADRDGSADDVFALMGQLVGRVEEATGIRLVAETVLVGFEPDTAQARTGHHR